MGKCLQWRRFLSDAIAGGIANTGFVFWVSHNTSFYFLFHNCIKQLWLATVYKKQPGSEAIPFHPKRQQSYNLCTASTEERIAWDVLGRLMRHPRSHLVGRSLCYAAATTPARRLPVSCFLSRLLRTTILWMQSPA